MPRCLCGQRGDLETLLAHCNEHWTDPEHGIEMASWQCGGCGLLHRAGEDPAVWEQVLPDGRQTLPICKNCLPDYVGPE